MTSLFFIRDKFSIANFFTENIHLETEISVVKLKIALNSLFILTEN